MNAVRQNVVAKCEIGTVVYLVITEPCLYLNSVTSQRENFRVLVSLTRPRSTMEASLFLNFLHILLKYLDNP